MRHVWEGGEAYTGFWWGNLRIRDRLEDPVVDGGYYQNGSSKVEWGIDWIDLAQDRDRWRAVVLAVMDLRAP